MAEGAQKVFPFLMFAGTAEKAMNFYTGLFERSEIIRISRYGPNETGKEGTVYQALFSIKGQQIMCIDSEGHPFTFTPSMSLFVKCDTEAELDRAFEALSRDGAVLMPLDAYPFSKKYAWVQDRYGVSWQLSWEE